jgi:hypothetical protein
MPDGVGITTLHPLTSATTSTWLDSPVISILPFRIIGVSGELASPMTAPFEVELGDSSPSRGGEYVYDTRRYSIAVRAPSGHGKKQLSIAILYILKLHRISFVLIYRDTIPPSFNGSFDCSTLFSVEHAQRIALGRNKSGLHLAH